MGGPSLGTSEFQADSPVSRSYEASQTIPSSLHAGDSLDAKLAQLSGYWQDRYGDDSVVRSGAAVGDPMKQLADVFDQIERYQQDGVA